MSVRVVGPRCRMCEKLLNFSLRTNIKYRDSLVTVALSEASGMTKKHRYCKDCFISLAGIENLPHDQ